MVNRRHDVASLPTAGTSKLQTGPAEPDDGREGTWTRQQLAKMDQRFRERVERAMRRGGEKHYSSK
jgi:hypothetical protein